MIHGFVKNGVGFLIDVGSGAVHVTDELAVAVADRLSPPISEECPSFPNLEKQFGETAVKEVYGELYQLYTRGLLFSPDYVMSKELEERTVGGSPVKALCLHVSHDCNLRCKYCFASTGDFGTGRLLMPKEVARAAIDFVIARSGARKNIEVDFFGGEPLMAFDVVKDTVEYARAAAEKSGKNFRFTITTNGLLLDDDKIEYINREMSNVVLSLDGRREVNDRMRRTVSGEGSYDLIVPRFRKVVEGREGKKDYYVRGTFTAYNLDFSKDVLAIAEEGFPQLSVEPVISAPSLPWALKEEHLPQIFAEYDKLTDELVRRKRDNRDFNFFHFMIDLSGGPCIIKRLRGCGAGFEYVAVTPEGDLYPCHQFVGNEDFRLGNVLTGTFDETLSGKFASIHVFSRESCRDCWAKYYCSGGCSAANFTVNGQIDRTYELGCEMEKKRVECAIYLKAVEADPELGAAVK